VVYTRWNYFFLNQDSKRRPPFWFSILQLSWQTIVHSPLDFNNHIVSTLSISRLICYCYWYVSIIFCTLMLCLCIDDLCKSADFMSGGNKEYISLSVCFAKGIIHLSRPILESIQQLYINTYRSEVIHSLCLLLEYSTYWYLFDHYSNLYSLRPLREHSTPIWIFTVCVPYGNIPPLFEFLHLYVAEGNINPLSSI